MAYLVHEHKQGDTFDMSAYSWLTEDTAPVLTGWSGDSQVRSDDGTVIETLTFVWLDAAKGLFRIYSVNDTSSWPLGKAYFDIQFTTTTGQIMSTPTVTVKVVKDITQ